MKKIIFNVLALTVISIVTPLFAGNGIDINDTRMLQTPAVRGNHIVFAYAGDLWTAEINGENVRRLTSHEGVESNPVFSPDGKWIAFSGEYDGNTDVYIVSADGGVPRRLTWHPEADTVRDFTPDGSAVLFVSRRDSFTRRYSQLFTVPVTGGFPAQLEIPNAFKAAYSPDGKQMAYTPLPEPFRQWKHYRGGTASRIWLYTFGDRSVVQVPQPEGRCNDTDPMWVGKKIYFNSDREGEFNLFSFDPASGEVAQLTRYTDYPILSASAGSGKIVFERAGYLYIFDPVSGSAEKLTVGVAADLEGVRPRYVSGQGRGSRFTRNASVSPSGARAVFEFRGEIVTVPAKKGDPRNLTETTGVHEREPVWSPDGESIAYFSDAGGEYRLHVKSQDGKGKAKTYALDGAGFYSSPAWSPDGKKIAYTDNSKSFYYIDLGTGTVKKITSDHFFEPGPFPNNTPTWSPDSRWIAYAVNTVSMFRRVYLYSIDRDKSFPVTDGLSDAGDPVFDKSGKYLYFKASTDDGPIRHWFALSNMDMRVTSSVYLAVLDNTTPSPLAKESDEEEGTAAPGKQDKSKGKDKGKDKSTGNDKEKPVTIDFDGLETRILALPIPPADYVGLRTGKEGELFFLEAPAVRGGDGNSTAKLHMFDLKKREDRVILPRADFFSISFDNKKILFRSGTSYEIADISPSITPGKNVLDTAGISVRIEPREEWKQVFDEAWRINRDYFYDPGMHGADWNAMKKKYEIFLPHLAYRPDLNRVIRWMCSEVGVGHHFVFGGDGVSNPGEVPGGLLGADYAVENGRYRFKKVFGGLNWNPDLRSPLAEPGVEVPAGDYLLAVNGTDLRPPDNIYRHFENTSGKIVEITVGPNPDGTGSRTLSVVPVPDERALRNRDWVEGNIRKVDEATNGRVAYVWLPNTSTSGHTYFKRYFFPQAYKDAVIVDERFNGGGSVADYYIDILRRPFIANWNMRYCSDMKTPSASIQGPKVMLIDETAGSGGDLLPWMFRKFKMGPLIGKRTWGGLVGTLGYPVLMDGGYVSAPNIGIWTEDGWVVENAGVPPDIEVEQWPKEVINGHDPQLEKAIEVILDELEKNPPKRLKRPPYPEKMKR